MSVDLTAFSAAAAPLPSPVSSSITRIFRHRLWMSRAAVVFYYHVTTFTTEVNSFWKREFNGATILFLANRYILLLYFVMELPTVALISDEVRRLLSLHSSRG